VLPSREVGTVQGAEQYRGIDGLAGRPGGPKEALDMCEAEIKKVTG